MATIIDLKGNTIQADAFEGDASGLTIPDATAAVKGVVNEGVAVADVTPAADGTAVGTAFNALLASLRTAGVIAT